MTRVAINEIVFRSTNPPVFARGTEVFVYERGTEEEAALYSAESGGTLLTQPLTTDIDGRPRSEGSYAWVEVGSYDLSFNGKIYPWEAINQVDLGELTTDVDLLLEAKINVKDYGAVGNNVADDTVAIQAAIAALPAAGGTLFFPKGAYKITGRLNLESKLATRLEGVGSMSSGTTPASLLVFTASGSEALINMKKTSGINWADLTLWATSATFTGTAIDLTEASYATFERGNFAHIGMEGTTEALTFKLKNSLICRFRDLTFGAWKHSFYGQFEAADFSNMILLEQCKFQGGTQAPIRNPGANWTLINCTFQPLAGGNKAGALVVDVGIEAVATTIINCGCYDAQVEGEWMKWRGEGLVVLGGLWGNGTVGIRAKGKGITIDGVWMQGPTNGVYVEESEDVHIGAGNYFTGVLEPVVVNGTGRSGMFYTDKDIEAGGKLVTAGAVISRSGGVWGTGAAAANSAFLAGVTADTFSRLVIQADGKMLWGTGAIGQDTNLYRAGADQLKTDDKLVVALEFQPLGDINHDGTKVGFFGKTPAARPNVKAASEVTAKELCEALETLGLVE